MGVHITEEILNGFSRLGLMDFSQLKVVNQMWYSDWDNWCLLGMTSGDTLGIFCLSLQIYSSLYPGPQRLNSIIFISLGSPDPKWWVESGKGQGNYFLLVCPQFVSDCILLQATLSVRQSLLPYSYSCGACQVKLPPLTSSGLEMGKDLWYDYIWDAAPFLVGAVNLRSLQIVSLLNFL